MKKIFLFASLLLAVALLFIFSSATTKPTVDSHKPVATFWPGARVTNNTNWVMQVTIRYGGLNQDRIASVAPNTTHTFEGSTNLIASVWARLDILNPVYAYPNNSRIGKTSMYYRLGATQNDDGIFNLINLGCGKPCNFTITQDIYTISANSDTTYKATVTKN